MDGLVVGMRYHSLPSSAGRVSRGPTMGPAAKVTFTHFNTHTKTHYIGRLNHHYYLLMGKAHKWSLSILGVGVSAENTHFWADFRGVGWGLKDLVFG